MPRLIITERAALGIERCRDFLAAKSPQAVERAGQAMVQRFQSIEANPAIGRPIDPDATLRELVIGFGESGYVALYRHEAAEDAVYVLAFRHQRESGY